MLSRSSPASAVLEDAAFLMMWLSPRHRAQIEGRLRTIDLAARSPCPVLVRPSAASTICSRPSGSLAMPGSTLGRQVRQPPAARTRFYLGAVRQIPVDHRHVFSSSGGILVTAEA